MLRAITRTTISIRPARTLDAATLAQMWELYEPHHHMDHTQFHQKLETLDEVALFRLRGDGALIGFCGVRRHAIELSSGSRVATFYMGLTYVKPGWRSNGLIQRVVMRRVLGPLLSPRFHRVYFWADCLTYRPYLSMARNLREYYPSRTRATSDEAREVIATLGRTYYGDSFDEKRGTVRKQARRIKQHEARVSATDLQDADIRFYMDHNRDYGRGDGLIAICPMGVVNLVHLLGRQLRKGRSARSARGRSEVFSAEQGTKLLEGSTLPPGSRRSEHGWSTTERVCSPVASGLHCHPRAGQPEPPHRISLRNCHFGQVEAG